MPLLDLEEQLQQLCSEVGEWQETKKTAANDKAEIERSVSELRQAKSNAAEQLEVTTSQVEKQKTLLERARHLEELGYRSKELEQLSTILGELAADHGLHPRDGIHQFFEFVAEYGRGTSAQLAARAAESQAARLQAEVERWEAEAQTKEIHSKSRIRTIDALEGLLRKGVKAEDIEAWHRVLEQTDGSIETFGTDLKKYGSVHHALTKKRQEVANLEKKEARLNAQVASLETEKGAMESAI